MTSIWTGDKVRLRGVEPEDWPVFRGFEEHSGDMRGVDMIYPPRSTATHRRWAEAQSGKEAEADEFLLAIETLEDRELVGSLSTANADRRAGRFTYGIGIGHDHQRRGYGSDAARLLLTYMFGERRYHKCEVHIYAFNQASIELHRRLGFQVEGRLREHEFFAGRHHDLVIMGLTFAEFAGRDPFTAP